MAETGDPGAHAFEIRRVLGRGVAVVAPQGVTLGPMSSRSTGRSTATAGTKFRARMDAELARVGAVLGQEIAWSPGECEILETIERDSDRRAALERAHAQCDDLGSARALKLAQEIRLIEAQTARLVKGLQRELSKLVAQKVSDDEQSAAPASVVSLKASRAANTRWHRERLRQHAAQVQYREPDETG
jgi:hypothetical protein